MTEEQRRNRKKLAMMIKTLTIFFIVVGAPTASIYWMTGLPWERTILTSIILGWVMFISIVLAAGVIDEKLKEYNKTQGTN